MNFREELKVPESEIKKIKKKNLVEKWRELREKYDSLDMLLAGFPDVDQKEKLDIAELYVENASDSELKAILDFSFELGKVFSKILLVFCWYSDYVYGSCWSFFKFFGKFNTENSSTSHGKLLPFFGVGTRFT